MVLHKIPELFGISGKTEITPLKKGHINQTFLVECNGKRYVLQSLNKTVFHAPETIMNNISTIEKVFEESDESRVTVPHFLSAEGRNFVTDGNEFWRMYEYILSEKNTRKSSDKIYLAGRSFGTFIKMLQNKNLSLTIKNFHKFDSYFTKLVNINKNSSKEKIDQSNMEKLCELKNTLSEIFTPELMQRNIHGDAKLDNVIIEDTCTVIDLDTAMPGFATIDFGDLIRSACKINSPNNLKIIESIAKGFADGLEGILTAPEINSLYYGIIYVTGELAIRYFIEFISENKYFKGKTSEDCLKRAYELMEQLEMFSLQKEKIRNIIFSAFSVQNSSL